MSAYDLMLQKLLERLGGQPASLKTILSDFEKALIGSVRKLFENVKHQGCRFHKYLALWKKLGEKGLQGLFHQSASFKEVVYMFFALCYVPEEDVVPLFNSIVLPKIQTLAVEDEDWVDYSDKLEDFGFYYETTWIKRRNGKAPTFDISLWNQFNSLCTDGHQTNNHLESYNQTFNKLAGQNPNVWKVHELFRSQEADTRRRFLNNAVGLDKSTNTGRK